jgi:thioredoxin-related protein
MITRRAFLAAAATALPASQSRATEPRLTDDGLFTQEWFLQSLLELPDDLALAASNGKRLAIMWELKGCPYCRETHVKNFGDSAISAYVRERFEVVQLNVIGARIVTDFDGEKLPERALADKYGVRFTPTFQFFPETADGLAGKKPRDREVARAQGYLDPRHFVALFRFVAEKAYERTTLRDYLRAQGA